MIWLTLPYGPAGLLGAYGGTIVVCMVWRLVGHGLRERRSTTCAISRPRCCCDVGAAVRQLQALLIFQDHGGIGRSP